MIQLRKALISVYHKKGLERILEQLHSYDVELYSTGGTFNYIQEQNIPVKAVEDLTGFPEVCDGRVKTLHPAVFAGILAREDHQTELNKHDLPRFDLVIVDLYPFENTLKETDDESLIIEKIDIGGIALIRAAAKNYKQCVVVSSQNDYSTLEKLLDVSNEISISNSKALATNAFGVSNYYDRLIHGFLSSGLESENPEQLSLRYGENPHQKAWFEGDLEKKLSQIQGKALSYNNLVDIDSAIGLIEEFSQSTIAFAVIKHTNACGLALGDDLEDAWDKALAGDPISAFGGVLVSNQTIDLNTAKSINKIFFEVLIAPNFSDEALEFFGSKKKKRTVIKYVPGIGGSLQKKSILNGTLVQEMDRFKHDTENWQSVGGRAATKVEITDLELANISVKHLKSNGISLVKNGQLIGMGCGQTSRVDALNQAINKAKGFNFEPKGAVMASDAFFPFPDCVEIAHKSGISAVVQPGGSIKDGDSIAFTKENNMAMLLTGKRHFKH